MRTTIDIPNEEIEDAMRFLGAKTKREAVVAALREFNRRRRMARLVRFSGSCDFDTNDEIERRETGEGEGGSQ
jgi:Arc/MetJ family transcription regulator